MLYQLSYTPKSQRGPAISDGRGQAQGRCRRRRSGGKGGSSLPQSGRSQFSLTTVTDLGGSVSSSLPQRIVPEIGRGTTALGASKLLTLSTRGAVSTSPAALRSRMPAISGAISAVRFGSTLVSASHSVPAASR